MKNKNKTIHVKPGPSERRLKICAVVISLLFAALMLYPLIFAISSSMKDNAKIYEIPPQLLPDSANSLLALIGRLIAPVFAPLGFADWRCATSLISGFIAKESVVSTLEVLLGGTPLFTMFTNRSAASFLVFTLLYTPCIAAVATIRREFGSTLKTVGVVLMQCCVAWIAASVVYALIGIL